jgi:hypothetical protein
MVVKFRLVGPNVQALGTPGSMATLANNMLDLSTS